MFVDVDHPAFAIGWLLRSLDEFFAVAGERVPSIGFAIEGRCDVDDKHPQYAGYVNMAQPEGEVAPLTEDEKDHIPAVRRMERMTDQLRYHVPVPFDDEGRANGDFVFEAEPGRIRFLFDQRGWEAQGCVILIEAKMVDGAWASRTEIRFDLDDGMSRTELAAGDGQAFLQNLFDPKPFGMALPVATGFGFEPAIGILDMIGHDTTRTQIVIPIRHDSFAKMENPNVR